MPAVGPELPMPKEWDKLGLSDVSELSEGHQSRVFSASSESGRLAVKLTDASLVELDSLERKMDVVADLARFDTSVARPALVRGELVHRSGDWYVTATSFVRGRSLDPSIAGDSELMGRALATLHRSMRRIEAPSLPEVATLRVVRDNPRHEVDRPQLIHGDFNATNMRLADAGIRIFDFDDCGYGPIEFDVANALYMVLFDSVVNDGSTMKYDSFRPPFVAAYADQSDRAMPDPTLDRFIDLRVRALDHWTIHLADAPIGIRTSSPAWIATLKQFVRSWSNRRASQ